MSAQTPPKYSPWRVTEIGGDGTTGTPTKNTTNTNGVVIQVVTTPTPPNATQTIQSQGVVNVSAHNRATTSAQKQNDGGVSPTTTKQTTTSGASTSAAASIHAQESGDNDDEFDAILLSIIQREEPQTQPPVQPQPPLQPQSKPPQQPAFVLRDFHETYNKFFDMLVEAESLDNTTLAHMAEILKTRDVDMLVSKCRNILSRRKILNLKNPNKSPDVVYNQILDLFDAAPAVDANSARPLPKALKSQQEESLTRGRIMHLANAISESLSGSERITCVNDLRRIYEAYIMRGKLSKQKLWESLWQEFEKATKRILWNTGTGDECNPWESRWVNLTQPPYDARRTWYINQLLLLSNAGKLSKVAVPAAFPIYTPVRNAPNSVKIPNSVETIVFTAHNIVHFNCYMDGTAVPGFTISSGTGNAVYHAVFPAGDVPVNERDIRGYETYVGCATQSTAARWNASTASSHLSAIRDIVANTKIGNAPPQRSQLVELALAYHWCIHQNWNDVYIIAIDSLYARQPVPPDVVPISDQLHILESRHIRFGVRHGSAPVSTLERGLNVSLSSVALEASTDFTFAHPM